MKTLLNLIGTLLILGVLLFQGILVIVIDIGIAVLNPRKVNKIWKNIFQETTESNSIN